MKVAGGEIVTVMGPSGSGKSSLLNYLCGNLSDDFRASGKVLLDDTEITKLVPEKRNLGILFQDDLLFPNMSVQANLAFGIPQEVKKDERMRLVEMALSDAGMEGYGKKDPATLSGGQRSRVSLMRALLARPKALLLDEPFSKLDQELRARIRKFTFSHAKEAGVPCILVTHDIEDAKAAGGRIFSLGTVDGDCFCRLIN